MQSLGQVLTLCLNLLQVEFAIDGLTFSWWKILLWTIVAGAVIYLIVKWSDDK